MKKKIKFRKTQEKSKQVPNIEGKKIYDTSEKKNRKKNNYFFKNILVTSEFN